MIPQSSQVQMTKKQTHLWKPEFRKFIAKCSQDWPLLGERDCRSKMGQRRKLDSDAISMEVSAQLMGSSGIGRSPQGLL